MSCASGRLRRRCLHRLLRLHAFLLPSLPATGRGWYSLCHVWSFSLVRVALTGGEASAYGPSASAATSAADKVSDKACTTAAYSGAWGLAVGSAEGCLWSKHSLLPSPRSMINDSFEQICFILQSRFLLFRPHPSSPASSGIKRADEALSSSLQAN